MSRKGGTRGGRDQFNWEDVKADKHRENFLGNSVKAAVGRWQQGRDILWYSRAKPKDGHQSDAGEDARARARAEKEAVKRREEMLMQEALGLKPRSSGPGAPPVGGQNLEKHDLTELLRRGRASEERDERFSEGERIKGLGNVFASHQQLNERAVLEGEGVGEGDLPAVSPTSGEAGGLAAARATAAGEPGERHGGGRSSDRRRRRRKRHGGGRAAATEEGNPGSDHHRHHHRRRRRHRSRSRSRERRHDSD